MAKTAEEKREARREYYARNREKILARNREAVRAWREANPEKAREAVRAYYARNREKILEQKKEQRRKKKDEKNAVVHGAFCGDAAGGVLGGLGSGEDEPVGTAGVCAADGAAAADLLEPGERGGDTP